MNLTLDEKLDELRKVGDPAFEKRWSLDHGLALDYVKVVVKTGLLGPATLTDERATALHVNARAVEKLWKDAMDLDVAAHPPPLESLEAAGRLFGRWGPEIGGALLLAALPEAYATNRGVRVLARTTELQSRPQRRIRATAQFLVRVMVKEKDVAGAWCEKDGPAWQATRALRLFHHAVRTVLQSGAPPSASSRIGVLHWWKRPVTEPGKQGPSLEVPLNQEDLLGTLLTFSVTVFDVLQQFGIRWRSEEQQAYLEAWNFIGLHLGIADASVAKLSCLIEPPSTVDAARRLLEHLRGRQWTPVPRFEPRPSDDNRKELEDTRKWIRAREAFPTAVLETEPTLEQVWASLEPGRRLLRALLYELEAAMPAATKSWPLAVIRQLAPERVRDRLALGGGGIASDLADHLSPPVSAGKFTTLRHANPLTSRVLRVMANEVTRRNFVRLVESTEEPLFVIPGLDEWSSGLRRG
jgi:mpaB/rubber oxygenase-like protein